MTYTVTLEPSHHTFDIEENEKILEAALRHGLTLPYGCRNGACGSCIGELLEGEVDYGTSNRSALKPDLEAAGKILVCQATARSNLTLKVREVARANEIEIKRLPVRVESLRKLSHDVMELKLKLPETERLQFFAGQYIDILLKDGSARAFSLANPPHRDQYLELHIRHVPGGNFTDYVFNSMKEKDLLRIEGPKGSFFLDDESTRPVLMIAGGTGFAPMRSMLEHAIKDGDKRDFHLFWGVRGSKDLYNNSLAEQWAEEHANISYTPVLSEPAEEDAWTGETGFVHEAVLRHYPELAAYDVYMAGPPVMVEATKKAFSETGLPEGQLHFDSFEFSSAKK
jgi:CDP-4-dehydro-6-deoxyglucose reductase, E3